MERFAFRMRHVFCSYGHACHAISNSFPVCVQQQKQQQKTIYQWNLFNWSFDALVTHSFICTHTKAIMQTHGVLDWDYRRNRQHAASWRIGDERAHKPYKNLNAKATEQKQPDRIGANDENCMHTTMTITIQWIKCFLYKRWIVSKPQAPPLPPSTAATING